MIPLARWELLDFDPGTGLDQDAATGGGAGWIPVSAPGDTYLALVAAGRLAHPFQGRGEDAAAWVRDREWWWRTTFDAPAVSPDETAELIFEGLDTFASIYLDGRLIGRTDNMFRRHVTDIGERLKPGARHVLAICFDPPGRAAAIPSLPVWSAFTDRVSRSRRNMIRKAQFGWGWDWGPDLPTVGVWKAAALQVRPRQKISDLRFEVLETAPDSADARIVVEVSRPGARATVEVILTDPQGEVVFQHQAPASERLTLPVTIPHPQLWWTADLGAQPLYALVVRLLDRGQVLDETRRVVGVRTVRLDQSADPDEPGTTFFRFVLNGVSIFAKGACWVPTTSFVAEVDDAAYIRLIDQSVGANMNMIRVWGGGIYEPDLFYDLCDRRGVLVWQDFMFACAHYPENDRFVASVAAEVEDQVRRLRHHPCLALWCGNNESQAMHRINADISGDDAPLSGVRLYDDLMPEILGRLDPRTPYWPGSPWGGPNPNSMRAGDVHDWTVWHGVPPIPDAEMTEPFASTDEGVAWTRYAEDTGRFISEFGIQAAPGLPTLRRWMDEGDLAPDSQGFLARIKDEARKADAMMRPVTGLPTTLQDYVDFTQWTQAEGLRFGIEHFRRRRPHCSGALLWQFNDCWPCVSWSLIDYDGVEKAGYQAVRRAFAPVLASFRKTDGDGIELWITNDGPTVVATTVAVTLEDLDGHVEERWTVDIEAAQGSHVTPWRGAMAARTDRVLRARASSPVFEPARHLFVPIAHLGLKLGVGPQVAFTRLSSTRIEVQLTAETYLAFVHLQSARSDIRFTDNHFDLAAGERRVVNIRGERAFGPGDLTVRCWNNRTNLQDGQKGPPPHSA